MLQVLRCVLEDFDVVYAPTLAGYGSCPATLQHCPGTRVQVSNRMHRSARSWHCCFL